MTTPQKTTAAPVETQKKPYQTPALVEYGAVHQFTQGSNGGASDGVNSMRMK